MVLFLPLKKRLCSAADVPESFFFCGLGERLPPLAEAEGVFLELFHVDLLLHVEG